MLINLPVWSYTHQKQSKMSGKTLKILSTTRSKLDVLFATLRFSTQLITADYMFPISCHGSQWMLKFKQQNHLFGCIQFLLLCVCYLLSLKEMDRMNPCFVRINSHIGSKADLKMVYSLVKHHHMCIKSCVENQETGQNRL